MIHHQRKSCMQIKLASILAALFLLLCEGVAMAEPKAWSFVQSVGGIAIGAPYQNKTGWMLSVRADVSGLQAITVNPTTLKSGLSCRSTEAMIEGQSIFLTIVTGVAGGERGATCPAADLGRISAGNYSVFYRGPNDQPIRIGEIEISH